MSGQQGAASDNEQGKDADASGEQGEDAAGKGNGNGKRDPPTHIRNKEARVLT